MDDHATKAKYFHCITGLVQCAGKYIAKHDYTNKSSIYVFINIQLTKCY
jgi:hypothetical protein